MQLALNSPSTSLHVPPLSTALPSAQVCRGDRGTIRFSLRPSVAVPLTLSDQLLGLPLSPFPLEYAKYGAAPLSFVLPSAPGAPSLPTNDDAAYEEGCYPEHRSALPQPGLEVAQPQPGTSCWKALYVDLSRTSYQRTRLLLSKRQNGGDRTLLQSTVARGRSTPPVPQGTADGPVFPRQPSGPTLLASVPAAALDGQAPAMAALR